MTYAFSREEEEALRDGRTEAYTLSRKKIRPRRNAQRADREDKGAWGDWWWAVEGKTRGSYRKGRGIERE